MYIQYKGKQAEIQFDSNRDGSIFVSSGFYVETNKDLTDEELDDITYNYSDIMWEAALNRHIMVADMMGDR